MRRSTIALALAFAALGCFSTWQAPFGGWTNRVFAFDLWLNQDPGGWYIPAAHDLLVRPGTTSFPGHPGLPLQLALAAEQWSLHAVARAHGAGLDITPYVARHTRAVWLAAGVSMVLLQLASFAALYGYARTLQPSMAVARLAVLLYATSFPVLYYLTRVSVESTTVLFFMLTVTCVARAWAGAAGRVSPSAWAALAGACAVSAFFSKVHLMAVWPLYTAAFLAWRRFEPPEQARRRGRLLAAYAAGCLAAGLFYSLVFDWAAFAGGWSTFTRATPHLAPERAAPGFFSGMALEVATALFRRARALDLRVFLPGWNARSLFSCLEALFLAAAAFGGWRALRRPAASGVDARLLKWLLGYGALVVSVWWYREAAWNLPSFHYLFPVLAILAPVAALGLARLVPALGATEQAERPGARALLLLLTLAIVHGAAFAAAVDSRRQDRAAYRELRAAPYTAALARAASDETVAVIDGAPGRYHALSASFAPRGRSSPLVDELDRLFLARSRPLDCQRFLLRARLRRVSQVVDFGLPDPGPRSLAAWSALPEAGRCTR